jgi:hypothetical protein
MDARVGGVDAAALLAHFPPVRLAFAYGSGALPQAGVQQCAKRCIWQWFGSWWIDTTSG